MAAIKLISLATAAAATSSSAANIPNNPLVQNNSNNNRLGEIRQLQDGSSYTYLDDLTGYSVQYANCIRAKIPQENDDDAVDGNVNFYNGAYRAQYQIYATFHLCGDGSSSDQCSVCDYDVEYTTDVNSFLETSMNYWDNYCDSCMNNCRRRKLEDNAANEEEEVDCSECNACKNYGNSNNDDGDETNYLDCQAGIEEDGMQLYYGPQCSDDGEIVIGVYYDDECTIKTNHDSPNNFNYYKFGTLSEGCINCSTNQGAESCTDLYGEAYHCVNGNDKTGQDNEMNACAKVKAALRDVDYSNVKKRHSGADAFLKMFFVLLLFGMIGGFFFLSYTYYIRHTGDKTGSLLSSDDVHVPETTQAEGGTLT